MTDQWDEDAVLGRLRHAAAVIGTLPEKHADIGRIRSSMPDIVRAHSEAYGYAPPRYRRPRWTPTDIDMAEEAMHWIGMVRRVADQSIGVDTPVGSIKIRIDAKALTVLTRIVLWMDAERVKPGKMQVAAARYLGFAVPVNGRTVRHWRMIGLGQIARYLKHNRVPLRHPER